MGFFVPISAKCLFWRNADALSLAAHYIAPRELRITTCGSVSLKNDFALRPCLKKDKNGHVSMVN
jgi:hypothetical protein